jgi:hypothetical protein
LKNPSLAKQEFFLLKKSVGVLNVAGEAPPSLGDGKILLKYSFFQKF